MVKQEPPDQDLLDSGLTRSYSVSESFSLSDDLRVIDHHVFVTDVPPEETESEIRADVSAVQDKED